MMEASQDTSQDNSREQLPSNKPVPHEKGTPQICEAHEIRIHRQLRSCRAVCWSLLRSSFGRHLRVRLSIRLFRIAWGLPGGSSELEVFFAGISWDRPILVCFPWGVEHQRFQVLCSLRHRHLGSHALDNLHGRKVHLQLW